MRIAWDGFRLIDNIGTREYNSLVSTLFFKRIYSNLY